MEIYSFRNYYKIRKTFLYTCNLKYNQHTRADLNSRSLAIIG